MVRPRLIAAVLLLMGVLTVVLGVQTLLQANRLGDCEVAVEAAEHMDDSYSSLTESVQAHLDGDSFAAVDSLGEATEGYEDAEETATDAGFDNYAQALESCAGEDN